MKEEKIGLEHNELSWDEAQTQHEKKREDSGISDYPSLRIAPDSSVDVVLDKDRNVKTGVTTQYGEKTIFPVIHEDIQKILWASDYLADRIFHVVKHDGTDEVRIIRTGKGENTRYGVQPTPQ